MPSTRTVVGVVLVVLVAVAGGVVALGGLDGPDTSSYLTVREADSDDPAANETVAFSELSPAQQQVFEDAAGTNGAVEIPDDVDRTVWIENSYVTYRNDTYWAAVAVPG